MSNEIKDWVLVPRVATDAMLDAGVRGRAGGGLYGAYIEMIAAAPTPPAEAQAVASLREMLELREATQNGRVTEKHELDIVRDARAALNEAQVAGGGGDDPQWFADALSAAGKSEPLPASGGFEEWFGAVWAGSDNIPVPEWRSEGWGRYVAQRQLALGAWEAALSAQPRQVLEAAGIANTQPASAPVGVDVDAVLARHLPSKYWDRAKAAFSALAQQPAAYPKNLRSIHAMILNALDRDAMDGRPVRGEMAAELRAAISAKQPAAVDEVDFTRAEVKEVFKAVKHGRLSRAVPDECVEQMKNVLLAAAQPQGEG